MSLLRYDQVIRQLPETKHLLLGNGFSIACDPVFSYPNLFDYVKGAGISQQAIKVFEYLGTNNFEGVMHLLENSEWVRRQYNLRYKQGNKATIKKDSEAIKSALVKAIAESHLANPGKIDNKRKDSCVKFLEPYHNVFTTNYDLLLYWVAMHGNATLNEHDGFRSSIEEPDAEYLVFQERLGKHKGILFLHGALHIYIEGGELRKHSWVRSNKTLMELIRDGLEKGQYPLFVAEGKPEKKLEQMQNNGYLFYCLGKLERIQQSLVIYGFSLGKSDAHIANAIADNLMLEHIYISIHGDFTSKHNKCIEQNVKVMQARRKKWLEKTRGGKELFEHYFDASTANIWS